MDYESIISLICGKHETLSPPSSAVRCINTLLETITRPGGAARAVSGAEPTSLASEYSQRSREHHTPPGAVHLSAVPSYTHCSGRSDVPERPAPRHRASHSALCRLLRCPGATLAAAGGPDLNGPPPPAPIALRYPTGRKPSRPVGETGVPPPPPPPPQHAQSRLAAAAGARPA